MIGKIRKFILIFVLVVVSFQSGKLLYILLRQGQFAVAGQASSLSVARPYYVEFRARFGPSFGHSYVVTGRVGEGARDVQLDHFGFTAEQTVWNRLKATIRGRGMIGKNSYDGLIPHSVTFRHYVSKETYDGLLDYVEKVRREKPDFELFGMNCNRFTGMVAEHLGLRIPSNSIDLPEIYVGQILRLNQSAP